MAIGVLFVRMLSDCSKSRRRLEAEILILRHQLNILRRSTHAAVCVSSIARCSFGFIAVALASSLSRKSRKAAGSSWTVRNDCTVRRSCSWKAQP